MKVLFCLLLFGLATSCPPKNEPVVLIGEPAQLRECNSWKGDQRLITTFPENQFGLKTLEFTGEAYDPTGNGRYDILINGSKSHPHSYLTPEVIRPTFNVYVPGVHIQMIPLRLAECPTWSGRVMLRIYAGRKN